MANAISEENAVRAANEVFYQALSAGSIEGISASCAHDSDVTALHETSTGPRGRQVPGTTEPRARAPPELRKRPDRAYW